MNMSNHFSLSKGQGFNADEYLRVIALLPYLLERKVHTTRTLVVVAHSSWHVM